MWIIVWLIFCFFVIKMVQSCRNSTSPDETYVDPGSVDNCHYTSKELDAMIKQLREKRKKRADERKKRDQEFLEEWEELDRNGGFSHKAFNEKFTEEQFEDIVHEATKHIKRVTDVYISGSDVRITVRSQSGISDWDFILCFEEDDKGITGDYFIPYSENDESSIPERAGDSISKKIKGLLQKEL